MGNFPSVGLVSVSVLVLAVYFFLSKIHKCTSLPPGPGGLFLIGSAHKLPLEYQEKTFFKWSKQYGACASHAEAA